MPIMKHTFKIEIQIETMNKSELEEIISKFKSILKAMAEEGIVEHYRITQWEKSDADCRKGKIITEWPKKKVGR